MVQSPTSASLSRQRQDRPAAAAGTAVAGRGVPGVGVVPVPQVGLPHGVDHMHRHAAPSKVVVGQSLPGSAAPPGGGTFARAVRGASAAGFGRTGSCASRCRGTCVPPQVWGLLPRMSWNSTCRRACSLGSNAR
jgi:hypothetical protein